MLQLKNISLNIQQQLHEKQEVGDYVTVTTFREVQKELQGEITASAAAYTAADVLVAGAAATSLSAASVSLQTQIALSQDKSSMSGYATESWVNSQTI